MSSGDLAESLNSSLDGWSRAMGLRFVRATPDEVVAELTVGAEHRQPHGIVHGGVYTGLIETVASIGASLDAMSRGQTAVGLENHTSFLRAVREGTLRATARPLVRGRRSQVWEAAIVSDDGKIAARGTVRLLCLDDGTALAGKNTGGNEPAR
jgi:uncharacterized protein (TIGR00369 family)